MVDELETIKKKKLEEMKKRYLNGGNKMENMPNTPIKITDADFNENIGKYGTVVVDCWAPWCGPCRMLGPVVDELAKELQGKIVFGKLNVDENRNTSTQYGIMSIPSLLVFKDGKHVDTFIGALPKPQLQSKLEQYI
ncbi:thioredoxin [Thermoplasmatales archaeon ex4572_165]|nr:MAG: thioredoxin [Thermoplasmatales archaeon ex4572_165]RLF58096.1 MAG: thioredoxin [Thermoplasmata archaeon]